jgi:hypothetical protein
MKELSPKELKKLRDQLNLISNQVAVPDDFRYDLRKRLAPSTESAPLRLASLAQGRLRPSWSFFKFWLPGLAAAAAVLALFVRPMLVPKAPAPSQVCQRVVCPSAGKPACISFQLKTAGPVKIEVFTPQGESVVALQQNSVTPGDHQLYWDGRDVHEKVLAFQSYTVVIKTKEFTVKQQIVKDPAC